MSLNQFVAIGFTKKTHGLKGELKVTVKEQYVEDFLKTETVFLEVKGKKVPYFIEAVRNPQDPIVKFEDINKLEEAQSLSSKEMYLREADILDEEEREIPLESTGYTYCEGFVMSDEAAGELGAILEVIDMPQSQMALLDYKGREVLVPMIPQFVKHIDKKGKKVMMDLPDGLLDM